MLKGRSFVGRSLARSQALQLLFQAELRDRSVEDVLAQGPCLEKGPLDDFGRELALGVEDSLRELDTIISARSAAWPVERMPLVDRNLLRIAIYEMLHVKEVDIAVAIDECVELAKAYGTDETPRFVNGILGRVADQLEAGEDPVELSRAELTLRKASSASGFGWESEASANEIGAADAIDGQVAVEGFEGSDRDVVTSGGEL
ncbi:transcription antitermination factor NusB [uncultured Olegusella sp.]|uniref:transcription antitermination factor NusB n=1 Tax=uncultured Olegusella sp. TaxID=1979846 RepID=UPI002632A851|nr:transcription antitermination factor NusB [uncultured Olegusella sp.]